MTPASLFKLINSLSSSEKRHFKLHSNLQSGNKDYLTLFDLIDKSDKTDAAKLKACFKNKLPETSWDNTCSYLGKMIMASLVKAKKDKDPFFTLLHEIQEAKILTERSLDQDAYKLINKVQEKAATLQQHWIQYFCYRYELNYHADNNFNQLNDEMLVKLQMKGKEVLKSLNHIHDHYSLYELLKHRLINSGRISSDEGRKKLNDLMLSEMVLVAGKSKTFASQKLHLLFQSYFFADVGDMQSALKAFLELNNLLEKNEQFLDNPPFDYLSALTGIIDILRSLRKVTEVEYYLQKINNLDQGNYPEYFRFQVKKTLYSQQLQSLIQFNRITDAKLLIEAIPKEVFENYAMVDEERQSELYFYSCVAYFKLKELKKAHILLREIMNQIKLPEQLMVSKAIRLMNIIIYYEKGDALHLEYEVRAYKRYFADTKFLRLEKLLLKMLSSAAAQKRLLLLPAEQKKFKEQLDKILVDKYEQQLEKYFSFSSWALQHFLPKCPHQKVIGVE